MTCLLSSMHVVWQLMLAAEAATVAAADGLLIVK
jgi:hypothetical protein